MKTEIEDRVYGEQLNQINENISEVIRELLDTLYIATIRICKGKRIIKPTITESLNFFILSNSIDLEHNIEHQRDRLTVLNLTLQPFIIFVGRDDNSINLYYYKCFFVLHICYPKESRQIWLLIQKCLYKMTTKYKADVINPKVVSIKKNFVKCKDYNYFEFMILYYYVT
ncbi:hypothetical protein ACFW04_012381 [Cataglyphis niger]